MSISDYLYLKDKLSSTESVLNDCIYKQNLYKEIVSDLDFKINQLISVGIFEAGLMQKVNKHQLLINSWIQVNSRL